VCDVAAGGAVKLRTWALSLLWPIALLSQNLTNVHVGIWKTV